MMMFDAKNMQLKQWTVTDPQGYDTTVAVYNLDASKKPDPGMFKIDFTQLPQLIAAVARYRHLTLPGRARSRGRTPRLQPSGSLADQDVDRPGQARACAKSDAI